MEKNRAGLFRLHNLATAYQQRPSTIAGIEDEWAAYQFDMACLTLGRRVENALSKNANKKKNARKPEAHILAEILGGPAEKQYASLADKRPARVVRPGDAEYEAWKAVIGSPPRPSPPVPTGKGG